MTQFLPTLVPELPDPFTGDDLADDWNEFIAAYQTGQLGATRPVWAAKGLPWSRDNGDGSVTLMIWDGSEDRVVGTPTQEIQGNDANAINGNGFFTTSSTTANLPSGIGSFGALINVERTAVDRGWQLYAPAAGTSEQRLFFRTQTNVGWDNWAEILHSESPAWRYPFGGDAGDSQAGIQLTRDGFIGATRNSDVVMRANRRGSNGNVIVIQNDQVTVGSISISGGSTSYNETSDGRVKTNLEDFDAGAIVDALKVYHYDRTDVEADGYGVVAQEAQHVFPHCVTQGSEAGPGEEGFEPWSVSYPKLVPVLIRDLQNVKAELRDTLDELQSVRARLDALEYRERTDAS